MMSGKEVEVYVCQEESEVLFEIEQKKKWKKLSKFYNIEDLQKRPTG